MSRWPVPSISRRNSWDACTRQRIDPHKTQRSTHTYRRVFMSSWNITGSELLGFTDCSDLVVRHPTTRLLQVRNRRTRGWHRSLHKNIQRPYLLISNWWDGWTVEASTDWQTEEADILDLLCTQAKFHMPSRWTDKGRIDTFNHELEINHAIERPSLLFCVSHLRGAQMFFTRTWRGTQRVLM